MNISRAGKYLGAVVSVSFAIMLVLMISLMFVGLTRMAAINQNLEDVVQHSTAKRDVAYRMNLALLERLVNMHSLLVISDSFDQVEEVDRLRENGTKFLDGRKQLEALAGTPQEAEILADIRDRAARTRPFTEQVVEEVLSGRTYQAQATIRTLAIPAQAGIVQQVNEFIDLQQRETELVVVRAAESYTSAQRQMLILGVSAAGLGLLISLLVVRNTMRQADLLQHQAMYDGLTGLPNRALFADRLQQAILIGRREKQPFALIAMDLDRFKEINDTLGHHVGDQVLRHAANCLRTCLRESDTVARMGGDEFTILLATADSLDGAQAAAKKILNALKEPLDIGSQKIEIDTSLGIVMFPEHGEDPAVLLREADAAMYLAKQTHGGYKVYSADLGQGADDRVALQGELRHALANNELVLHYQPKIDLTSNRVTGVEALVRWQHPRHGLLAPDKFIPLAEQTGLVKALTQYVLASALGQCEQWQRAGLDLTMSVNISAINLQDPEFPDQVAELLKGFTVSPSRLELEVTETAVMAEPVRAVACIKKLSALGLQIAIDDFGTGYSSMSYLKDLLVAKIKIDKSFVKDMAVNHNDAVIVRSTVELGHSLGLKVIAEGVETEAVWDRLKALGCDDAQGYYMGRPLPVDKFSEWLQQSPWGLKTANK